MDRQTSFQSGFGRRFSQLMEKSAGKLNKGNAANVFGGTQMKKKTKPSPAAAAAPVKAAPVIPPASSPIADPAPAPMKITPPVAPELPVAAPEATPAKPGIAELLSKATPAAPTVAPQFEPPVTAPKTNIVPTPVESSLPTAAPADPVGDFRARLREMIAKGNAAAAPAPALSLPMKEAPIGANVPGVPNLQAAPEPALPPNEELASKAKSLVKGAASRQIDSGNAALLGALPFGSLFAGIHGAAKGDSLGQGLRSGGRTLLEGTIGGGSAQLLLALLAGGMRNVPNGARMLVGMAGSMLGGAHGAHRAAENFNARQPNAMQSGLQSLLGLKQASIKVAGRGDIFRMALGRAGIGMRDYSATAAKRFGGHHMVSGFHPTELASSMERAISGKLPPVIQGMPADSGVRQMLRGNAALDLNSLRKAQWASRRAEQSAAGAATAQNNAYSNAKGIRDVVRGPSPAAEPNFTMPGRAVALRPRPAERINVNTGIPPIPDAIRSQSARLTEPLQIGNGNPSRWRQMLDSAMAHPAMRRATEFYGQHKLPVQLGGVGAGMVGSNLYGQHQAAEEARRRAAQASFMQRLMYLVNPQSVYSM